MQKQPGSDIPAVMDSVLIRYHEIALKKGNRAYFTELLKRNIALRRQRSRRQRDPQPARPPVTGVQKRRRPTKP